MAVTHAPEPGTTDAWTTADPADYPELPYPGTRPPGSWRLTATKQLRALSHLDNGRVQDLQTGETASLADRILVLAYGSNANPQKLLRHFAGTDVFALEAQVDGWAAVWCAARRGQGDVVCTLAPVPGAREHHLVLAVTPTQLKEMDRFEGHPRHYLRTAFTGHLTLSGWRSPAVQVYLGTHARRPVLLIDGQPLCCGDVPHSEVDQFVPRPA